MEKEFEEAVEEWTRKVRIPYTARAAVTGRGVCLGLTVSGKSPRLGWFNEEAPDLVAMLNGWLRTKLEQANKEDFRWTSIQVNQNTVSREHVDRNNKGPSIIVTAGEYEGGEFQVTGSEEFNPKGKVWTFNGLDPHKSLPFKGESISLIWFAHSSWREASEEQMRTLEELGFRPPARNAEMRGEPQKTEIVNEHLEERPIANLAFFDGIGSMVVVLKRLYQRVVAHLSWETDEVTKDFLASTFPRVVQMGCVEATQVEDVRSTLERMRIPANTLVVISGGPPCVDHSRIKGNRAPEERESEGRKLNTFARLVKELKGKLPWECTFLIEHTVPWGRRTVEAVNNILGVEAVLADAADLKLIRKPMLWWTDTVWGADVKWDKSTIKQCPRKVRVEGIEVVSPKEVKVGSIDAGLIMAH